MNCTFLVIVLARASNAKGTRLGVPFVFEYIIIY